MINREIEIKFTLTDVDIKSEDGLTTGRLQGAGVAGEMHSLLAKLIPRYLAKESDNNLIIHIEDTFVLQFVHK